MEANVNPETGVRYGVVALASLQDWVFEEFFNDGVNQSMEDAVLEWESEHPDFDEDEKQTFIDYLDIEEATYVLVKDDMQLMMSYLGGAPLVWVIKSPHRTSTRLCSPCVPNAGDLDAKDKGGCEGGFFECYDLPADWYMEAK